MRRDKRVSSKDVARESGVSQATVSYVLNNNPHVKIKPETRQNVLDAAKRLNYHVNFIARNMRLRRAASIGVVINSDMSSYQFIKVLEGIKESLEERNYSMTICFGGYDDIQEAEFVKYFYSNLIDGVIFVQYDVKSTDIRFMETNEIPYVLLDSNILNNAKAFIKNNIQTACNEAVADLKASGVKKVGYLGPYADISGSLRYDAYLAAMKSNGLRIYSRYIYKCSLDEDKIRNEVQAHLLPDGKLPDALICDDVTAAFHAVRHLKRIGITIPDDMQVIMMGSSAFSTRVSPSLSTIEPPIQNIGFKATKLLFHVLDNGLDSFKDNGVEWTYVKRESSK